MGMGRPGGRPLQIMVDFLFVGADSTSLALRSKFAKQTSHPPDSKPSPAGEHVASNCRVCKANIEGTALTVDEEFTHCQDTSSVSLRLPPSPTGEGFKKRALNERPYEIDYILHL